MQYKDINIHLNKFFTSIHPDTVLESLCGVLIFTPFYKHPVETLISCTQEINLSMIICSQIKQLSFVGKTFPIQNNTPIEMLIDRSLLKCQNNWFPFVNSCFTLIPNRQAMIYEELTALDKVCNASGNSSAKIPEIQEDDNCDLSANSHLHAIIDFLTFMQQSHQRMENIYMMYTPCVATASPILQQFTAPIIKQYWSTRTLRTLPFYISKFSTTYQAWVNEDITGDAYSSRGLFVCEQNPDVKQAQRSCHVGQYKCTDGSCISPFYVCDEAWDCEKGEDETGCPFVCQIDGELMFTSTDCQQSNCLWPDCQCGMLYIFVENEGCIRTTEYQIEHPEINGNNPDLFNVKYFQCSDGNKISEIWVNDLVPDCVSEEDEEEYKLILLQETMMIHNNSDFISYLNKDSMPCTVGHTKHFPKDKLCVVDHDNDGHLRYCRNGLHLQHCEYVRCVGMFKCHRSYCLPVHKVCNSIKDCPRGEDEMLCNLPLSCPGMLRCKAGFCVEDQYICDGIKQCPHNDDEMYCHVGQCPENCHCIGAFLNCTSANMTEFPTFKTEVFVGSQNRISIAHDTFHSQDMLIILDLRQNEIISLPLGIFQFCHALHYLDLSYNAIKVLKNNIFVGLEHLKDLNLEGNKIRLIQNFTLADLKSLVNLDLSNMIIDHISSESFVNLKNLKLLDLSKNNLVIVDTLMFVNMRDLQILNLKDNSVDVSRSVIEVSLLENMVYIGSDDGRFCCMASKLDICDASSFKTTECLNLISLYYLKVQAWCMGILGVSINIYSITFNGSAFKRSKKMNHLLILVMAVADSLTSLYMVGIGTTDVILANRYITYDHWWRHNGFCFALAFMHNFSMELSLFSTVQLTALYTYVIVKQRKPSLRWSMMHGMFSWTAAFLLSGIPLIFFKMADTPMCLFHVDPSTDHVALLVHLIAQHLVINVVILAVNVYLTLKSISTIMASTKTIKHHGSKTKQGSKGRAIRHLVTQLCVRLLIWIPLMLALLTMLLGASVTSDIATTMILTTSSLNLLINPLIFTLRSLKKSK